MNYSSFLQDRLYYQSDLLLQETADRKEFERLARELILHLDFTDLNRERILLAAHDFLNAATADERKKALVLSLLDGGIDIIRATEAVRDQVVSELHTAMEDIRQRIEPDEEMLDDLATTITELSAAPLEELQKILERRKDLKDRVKRKITPFESAFIRSEFREHRRRKAGNHWDRFRDKLAAMFGLSEMQIAAVKAWESDSLKEKGGKTIYELIEEIRIKIEKTRPDAVEKSVEKTRGEREQAVATENAEPADVSDFHGKFFDAEDRGFLASIQPRSFALEKGKITSLQRRWIFGLVLLAKEEDRAQIRKFLAERIFGCSVSKIAAITAYLTGGCRERASEEIREDIEATEAYMRGRFSASTAVPTSEESQVQIVSEGGEHFDYDNEIKRAWRKKLQEFVAEHTKPEERAKMRVLCLPGKKCLEIPVYTELGFKPENIVGVEGGDLKAQEEFAANGKRFGFDYRAGTLLKIAGEEKRPFSVVSLDFLGPMCREYEMIIEQLYLTNNAAVLLNFMAQRENKRTQYQLKSGNFQAHILVKNATDFLNAEEEFIQGRHEKEIDEQELADAREFGYVSFAKYSVGFEREENMRFGRITAPVQLVRDELIKFREMNNGMEPPDFVERNAHQWVFSRCLQEVRKDCHGFLTRAMGRKSRLIRGDLFAIVYGSDHLTFDGIYGRPFVIGNKRYGYSSHIGPKTLQYHSEFILFDTPRDLFERTQATISFFNRITQFRLNALASGKAGGGFAFLHRGNVVNQHYFGNTDSLVFVDSTGKIIARLPWNRLMEDINLYHKRRRKTLDPPQRMAETRKEMIP